MIFKLLFSPKFVAGAAIGYVLGTRAGREQYERIMAAVGRKKEKAVEQAREHGVELFDKVKEKTPLGSDPDAGAAAVAAVANGHPMHATGRG